MTDLRRWRALVALALYLGVGLGVPLADGLFFHERDALRVPHLERPDADCHRGECSLDAPGAPHAPAQPPRGPLRVEPGARVGESFPPRSPRAAAIPAGLLGPRAPPPLT